MREIEAIKERGIYDIDVLDDGKDLIGLTVDTKRNQYYVVTPEDGVIGKNNIEAYNFLKDEIISKIAKEKAAGSLTGETKVYAEEILSKVLPTLGIYAVSEKENKENVAYLTSLKNEQTNELGCSYR